MSTLESNTLLEQVREVEISRACAEPSQMEIDEAQIVGRLRELVDARKQKIEEARLLQLDYKRRRTDDVHLWVKTYMLKLVSELSDYTLKLIAEQFATSNGKSPWEVKKLDCFHFDQVIDLFGEDAKTCSLTWIDVKNYLNNHNLIVIIDDIHSDFYGCGLSFAFTDASRDTYIGSRFGGGHYQKDPHWTFSVTLSMGEHPYTLESEVIGYSADKDPIEKAKKMEIEREKEKVQKAKQEQLDKLEAERQKQIRLDYLNSQKNQKCCTIM